MSKAFQGFLLCSLLSVPFLGHSNAHAAGAVAYYCSAAYNLGRHDRKDLAVDDAVVFQLAKLLGQHAFTDVGNFAPQFTEAADLIPQPEQDEGLPFAPDHFQGGFHRAVVPGSRFRFICSHTYHGVSITPHYAYLFHTLVNLTMPASNGDYRKVVKALISGYLTRSTHDEN